MNISAFFSLAAIAATALVLGLIVRKKAKGSKAVPWLFLIAGFGLAGLIGRWLDWIAGALTSASQTATAYIFGVGLPGLIAVAFAVYLFFHLKPKGQKPTAVTPWIALLTPALLMTSVSAMAGLTGLIEDLTAATGQAAANLINGIGG